MTKAEILKQIEELSEVKNIIRTLPIEDEKYTCIAGGDLRFYTSCYPDLFDEYPAKENSSIGNYFKSDEDAEMVVRAMQIEHSIRIRRIELNDGWEPDWDDISEDKYYIGFAYGYIYSNKIDDFNINSCPVFGYYKSYNVLTKIKNEFKDDLEWYFTEYYPNRDKMYVWG